MEMCIGACSNPLPISLMIWAMDDFSRWVVYAHKVITKKDREICPGLFCGVEYVS
jgi:hypothetical protein